MNNLSLAGGIKTVLMGEEKHVPGQDLDEDQADDQEITEIEGETTDDEDKSNDLAEDESEKDDSAAEEQHEDQKGDQEGEESDKEEAPDDSKAPIKKDRTIYVALKERKGQLKEARERISQLEKALEERDQKDIDEEIAAIAEEEGITFDQAKNVFNRMHDKTAATEKTVSEEKQESQAADDAEDQEDDSKEEEDNRRALATQRENEDAETRSELTKAWEDSRFKLPEIVDPAEKERVAAEVVRLSHLPKYHDKSVRYILFEEQENITKLVSPKRPSFEGAGTAAHGEVEETQQNFNGRSTPMQMQEQIEKPSRSQSIVVRKSH